MTNGGVATVWMPVDDMDRAVRFYGDILGLTVKSTGDDWSELSADGLTIGLNAREATHRDGTGGAVVTFHPDGDLFNEVVRLTEAGVEFVDDVASHPWGRIASFKDSEGNDLQLFEPPPE
ncbi:VOC family protein [Candidatus Mycobacterium wuenschmannii]|uniref:VOC family protein n=1 Tax=Candidatus Mycobacterium wuenschmannii TaxID=3027808 RepID=A0ABY8VVG2_9MYCO|nr:VOC family protein [Candidatus Mycobacterium wuenschmannii]WIM86152.1 VOC family protein [Candidatus Mycobacterium wuenschmannii]